MSRNNLFILILFVSFISVVIFFITKKEESFKIVKLPDNHSLIYNDTKTHYLDSIVLFGLHKLNIDSVNIVIKSLQNESVSNDNRNVYGKLIKNDKIYGLYLISDLSRKDYINIISHELIHLQQYQTNKLIVEKDSIQWESFKNSTNNWMLINYNNRPWELEAFENQDSLINYITKTLY